MKRKCQRAILMSGVSTINIRGKVKSSVDALIDDVTIYLDDHGLWVTYQEVDKDPKSKTKGLHVTREQLIPVGSFSNVLFDPKDLWEGQPTQAPAPATKK